MAQKAVKGLPLEAKFWFNLAQICGGLGKEVEARNALAEVVRLAPETTMAQEAKSCLG